MKKRPHKTESVTHQVVTPCGAVYVTLTKHNDKLFEVFATHGKAGGCVAANKAALASVISVALRSGADPEDIAHVLKGIQCHQGESCLSLIGGVMEKGVAE